MSSYQVAIELSSQQEGEEEERRNQGKICGRTKGDPSHGAAAIVQNKQDGRRECACAWNRPGDPVVEQNHTDAAENERGSKPRKVVESDAGNRGSGRVGAVIFMFPGVDEEAVETAKGREE
jgi:hypothetical protein